MHKSFYCNATIYDTQPCSPVRVHSFRTKRADERTSKFSVVVIVLLADAEDVVDDDEAGERDEPDAEAGECRADHRGAREDGVLAPRLALRPGVAEQSGAGHGECMWVASVERRVRAAAAASGGGGTHAQTGARYHYGGTHVCGVVTLPLAGR
jgi:hypothetical protein